MYPEVFEIPWEDVESWSSIEDYLEDFCRNLSQPRGEFFNYDNEILPDGFKFE